MKTTLFKMALPLVTFAASLVASEAKLQTPAPIMNHRVSIHPTNYSYEYVPTDDIYFGIDVNKSTSYSKYDVQVDHLVGDFRLGRSFEFNPDTILRPFVGVSSYRNISHLFEPVMVYGLAGFSFEKTVADILTVGVTAKGLFGGIVGKNYGQERKWYYGADVSLPISIRFGRCSHWEMRVEPFALVVNDGEHYVGHRSAIAYRF